MLKMPQQQRSTTPASRFSMDSQEGSWSSSQHLMASSDQEMQDEKRISAKCQCRRYSQILWMHVLLIILYTFTFIVAIHLWNSHGSQHFAYCKSSFLSGSMPPSLQLISRYSTSFESYQISKSAVRGQARRDQFISRRAAS